MIDDPSVRGARILVVDDDEIILIALAETLKHAGYKATTTQSPREALDFLRSEPPYAVIISDQKMNELTGLEFLQAASKIQPNASRILITGVLTIKTVISAINTGEIYRFIAKPWMREDLLATVRNAVQRHQLLEINRKLQEDTFRLNEQLAETNASLQARLRELTQQRDEARQTQETLRQSFAQSLELVQRIVTAYHPRLGDEILQVVDLCERMAEGYDLGPDGLHVLRVAAWLHNVGLIGVSMDLLVRAREQPGSISEDERSLLRNHPIYGQMLALFVEQRDAIGETIRASHERWDGSGYPDGLRGEAIPRPARLLAVAVHYAESNKPREETIDEILRLSGSAFEPTAVDRFLVANRSTLAPQQRAREVSPDELRPGMILARSIYSPTGLLLFVQGQRLNETHLDRIRRHRRVYPSGESLRVYG